MHGQSLFCTCGSHQALAEIPIYMPLNILTHSKWLILVKVTVPVRHRAPCTHMFTVFFPITITTSHTLQKKKCKKKSVFFFFCCVCDVQFAYRLYSAEKQVLCRVQHWCIFHLLLYPVSLNVLTAAWIDIQYFIYCIGVAV